MEVCSYELIFSRPTEIETMPKRLQFKHFFILIPFPWGYHQLFKKNFHKISCLCKNMSNQNLTFRISCFFSNSVSWSDVFLTYPMLISKTIYQFIFSIYQTYIIFLLHIKYFFSVHFNKNYFHEVKMHILTLELPFVGHLEMNSSFHEGEIKPL